MSMESVAAMTNVPSPSAILTQPKEKSTGAAPLDVGDVGLRDEDRDALYVLPLSIIPLKLPALRRARLIKNVRLEGVVEFFADPQTGSGQVDIKDLPMVFGWPDGQANPDFKLLKRLADLPSYDVYSLRILLREMNIPISDARGLSLSESKVASLDVYMSKFTRPLVAKVFGGKEVGTGGAEDLVRMFREAGSAQVRDNLQTIAGKLGIEIMDLPRFLEDCGDIFLALSYYRQCLDEIEPAVGGLLDSIHDIRANRLLSENTSVMETCTMIESTIGGQMASVGGRVEKFDRVTNSMWDDVSAQRFREVKEMIQSYHTAVGGVLCALTVKIKAWATQFPNPESVGAKRRADFLMSDMKQGIEKILKMEGMTSASGRVLQ